LPLLWKVRIGLYSIFPLLPECSFSCLAASTYGKIDHDTEKQFPSPSPLNLSRFTQVPNFYYQLPASIYNTPQVCLIVVQVSVKPIQFLDQLNLTSPGQESPCLFSEYFRGRLSNFSKFSCLFPEIDSFGSPFSTLARGLPVAGSLSL